MRQNSAIPTKAADSAGTAGRYQEATSAIRKKALAAAAEQTVQGHNPLDSAGLLGDAIGAQQITHPSTCADDPQHNAARCELVMQSVEHARARQIDVG